MLGTRISHLPLDVKKIYHTPFELYFCSYLNYYVLFDAQSSSRFKFSIKRYRWALNN